MEIPITTVTTAVLSILFVALTLRVIIMRRSNGISVGTGNDEQFVRAVRAHGNFAEYSPLFLFMLLVLELQHVSFRILLPITNIFIFGRIIHAIGFGIIGKGPGRVLGMICTNTVLLIQSGLLLYIFLTSIK